MYTFLRCGGTRLEFIRIISAPDPSTPLRECCELFDTSKRRLRLYSVELFSFSERKQLWKMLRFLSSTSRVLSPVSMSVGAPNLMSAETIQSDVFQFGERGALLFPFCWRYPGTFTGPIQDFEKIRRQCRKYRNLFEDPLFPCIDEVVQILPEQKLRNKRVDWMRPQVKSGFSGVRLTPSVDQIPIPVVFQEICLNPRFFEDSVSRGDVIQGELGKSIMH